MSYCNKHDVSYDFTNASCYSDCVQFANQCNTCYDGALGVVMRYSMTGHDMLMMRSNYSIF